MDSDLHLSSGDLFGLSPAITKKTPFVTGHNRGCYPGGVQRCGRWRGPGGRGRGRPVRLRAPARRRGAPGGGAPRGPRPASPRGALRRPCGRI